MDYTCRACSIGRLSQDLTDSIYRVEQNFKIKPVAFGKRLKSKRLKSKRLKSKRTSENRTKKLEKN
jgi:hypothetical protein